MTVFDILILIAIAAVAITLALGIRSLYRTGPEARTLTNRLMGLGVALHALAVVLLVAGMWWKSTHGS